jgi:hypothetical protein
MGDCPGCGEYRINYCFFSRVLLFAASLFRSSARKGLCPVRMPGVIMAKCSGTVSHASGIRRLAGESLAWSCAEAPVSLSSQEVVQLFPAGQAVS